MHKKLMLACMAIAAFAAFVIAPAASASPVLTESGSALAVGASVEGKNTGTTLFETSTGNVTCTTAVLKGSVTENNGTSLKGTIPVGSASFKGTGSGEDCTSTLFSGAAVGVTVNSELCLAAAKGSDNLTVTGCESAITFSMNFTGIATCKYEQTGSLTGTFTTNTTPAPASISKQPANGESTNSFVCPAKGELTMTFDMYTTGGTTGLTIS